MDPERWERVQSLFHRAADLAEPERSRFLTAECGGDAALAAEVRRMVEEDARDSLLDREVAGLAGERIAFGHTSTSVNDDLHAATNLARSMVTSFGMSDVLGLAVRMRLSTRAIRTIEKKGGIDAYLLNTPDGRLTVDAKALKRRLLRARAKQTTAQAA